MVRYPKNWTAGAIDKYITQEAQEKDRDAFGKTHVPISRIGVEENKVISDDDWVDEDEQFVDEEAVLRTVTDSTLEQGNRLFFVVGESGSGKSELCQWLDYEIQDQAEEAAEGEFSHEPILIPRHVREPRDVLQLLTENLEGWDFEDAKYLADLPESGIFKSVTGNILNQFNKRQEATVDFLNDEVFEEIVQQNLRKYVDSFSDPDEGIEFEPISQDELEDLLSEDFPRVTHEHEDQSVDPVEFLYREIKSAATDAIEDMLFDGDIVDVLHDIDSAYRNQNQRPVLIIEDLTGFTIYDHQVLSFFSDLGAAHFDVVVGVTTGVHRRLIDQRRADVSSEDTINDRTQARFKLTEPAEDGSGSRTLFLEQEDVHIELARKYLTAIKSEDEIPYDPPLPEGMDETDLQESFDDGLYPFNEAFLTRIYENLQEDNVRKQTPRIYLNFVIEELLNNQNPPFQHAEKLQQRLGVVEDHISSDYQGADQPVLKWYGTRSGDTQIVDRRIPEVFDIESSGEVPLVVDPSQTCPECGASIYDDSDDWVCPNCDYSPDGLDERKDLQETYNDQQNELLAWLKDEADFNQTTNIETGAERVIRYFHDKPDSLIRPECFSDTAAYFRYEKGSTRIPVHVDNGDEPRFTQVVLSKELDEGLLMDLLRIGVWEDVAISNHDQNGNIDLERLRDWADEAVKELRSSLEADIEDTYGADIDEIAIFSKYLLNVFSGKSTDLSAEALSRPVDEDDILHVFARTEFEGNTKRLAEKAATLRGLFHGRFHLRKSVIDFDRLENKLEYLDRETLLLRISNIDGKLGGFKIGPKGSDSFEFDGFLKDPNKLNLRGYAVDIDEFSAVYANDLDSLRTEFEGLHTTLQGFDSGVDIDALDSAYAPLSRQKPSELEQITEYDTNELAETMAEIDAVASDLQRCESVWEYFLAKRRAGWIKYHEPHVDRFDTLQSFVDELNSLEQDLDARIDELEEKQYTPDTEPFQNAQSEADALAGILGGEI